MHWGGGIEFGKDGKMGFYAQNIGGSSIVYQCLMDRFDDIAFDWRAESGVDWFRPEIRWIHTIMQVESDMVLHTFVKEENATKRKTIYSGLR